MRGVKPSGRCEIAYLGGSTAKHLVVGVGDLRSHESPETKLRKVAASLKSACMGLRERHSLRKRCRRTK